MSDADSQELTAADVGSVAQVVRPKSVLVRRLRRDGTMSLIGSVPDEHSLTSDLMRKLVQEGNATIDVVLHFAEGDVHYRVTGVHDAAGWYVTRIGGDHA